MYRHQSVVVDNSGVGQMTEELADLTVCTNPKIGNDLSGL